MIDCVVEPGCCATEGLAELRRLPVEAKRVEARAIRDALYRTHDWFNDHAWIKRSEAVDANSCPVDALSDAATGFCIQGALVRANPDMDSPLFIATIRKLNAHIAQQDEIAAHDLFEFNDDVAVDIAEVRRMLREVAQTVFD